MTKIDALRRIFLPCFTISTVAGAGATPITHTAKKRLSTSLRDDIQSPKKHPLKTEHHQDHEEPDETDSTTTDDSATTTASTVAPRPSRTMVIGTIFGHRRGHHVWFCVQHDRLNTKPTLLLELSIPTRILVKEMHCGLVRIALETEYRPDSEIGTCPLHSVPVWTLFCNGRKLGYAVRKRPTEQNRLMLKAMQSTTVGAGVIPSKFGSAEEDGELMYMRANYECVIGGADSESFHLINPDEGPGQELSIFLLRSR